MKTSFRKLTGIALMSAVSASSTVLMAAGHSGGGSSSSNSGHSTSSVVSSSSAISSGHNSSSSTGGSNSSQGSNSGRTTTSNHISGSTFQAVSGANGNSQIGKSNNSSQSRIITNNSANNSAIKSVTGNTGNTGTGKLEHHVIPNGQGSKFIDVSKQHELSNAADRLKVGHLDHIISSKSVQDVNLKKQFELHAQGDVARRMDLAKDLANNGGWEKHHQGVLSPNFHLNGLNHCYFGPNCYSKFCFFPSWSPWVNWCWNFQCLPWWDPRPIWCQPIFYLPCNPWVVWNYPVWCQLPVCYCGTWVDVPVVQVANGIDVQLLAVRFVDGGHPEKGYGPRYRVFFRNNSNVAINQPFDVLAYASNSELPAAGMPQMGVRVTAMRAGETQSVDLRLPADVNSLSATVDGQTTPFHFLHVIVDARRELVEANKTNNGVVLDRQRILPVDPAVFSAALNGASEGATINIAGEGFGPEAGQVLVTLKGVETPIEIQGWYDLGVQIRVPKISAEDALKCDVTVIRGDKAASNPAPVKMPAATAPSPMPVQ